MVAILDVFGKAYFTNRARPIIYPREPNFDVSGVGCQDGVRSMRIMSAKLFTSLEAAAIIGF